MGDDGLLGRVKQKLIETKQKWAGEGRLLTGAAAEPGTRLPPGQREVKNWPVLDLGVQPNVPVAAPSKPVVTAPTATAAPAPPAKAAVSSELEAQLGLYQEQVRQLQADKSLLEAKLKEAFAAARVPAEIEVYAAMHGWCVRDMPMENGAPIYSMPDAERAWRKLIALYGAALA